MTQSPLERFQADRQLREEEARTKRKKIDRKIKETSASKVVRGLVSGGVTAVNEGAEVFDDIYDSFAGNPYDNEDLINLKTAGLKIDSDEGDWRYEVPHMVGQYILPGGAIFKGLKFLPLAARGYAAGAIVDGFLTDPYEKNLFNIAANHAPTFLKPLLNVFSAPDEEISVHIARLKAVGAGGIQGKVVEKGVGVVGGVAKGAAGAVKDVAKSTTEKGSSLLDTFIDKVLEMRNNPGSRARMQKALKDYEQVTLSDVQEIDQMLGSKKLLEDIKPEGVPKRGKTFLDIPDTRGQNEFYHGAASDIELVEGGEFGKAVENLYGDGFYVTEDLVTAAKYQKKNRVKGKKPTGVVYKVTEKQPVKFFDLDAPATPERIDQLRKIFNVNGYEEVDIIDRALDQIGPNPSIAQIYDEIKLISNANDLSAATTSDLFASFTDGLQREGFGGLTHQGGKKAGKGKRLHQVRIYFDPANSIDINKVDLSQYDKSITGESLKGIPPTGQGVPVDQTYNVRTINTNNDLKELLLSRLEQYKQKGQFPEKRSFANMAQAARRQLPQDTVLGLERFVNNFGPGGKEDLPAMIIAMNDLVHESLTNVGDLAKQLDQTMATGNRVRYDEIKEEFASNLKIFDGLINIHRTTKNILGQSLAANKVPANIGDKATDIQSLFGRTPEEKFLDQAQNLRATPDDLYADPLSEFSIDDILKIADDGDTKQLRTLVRKIQIASQNPNALKTLINEGGGTRFLKITNEIFINSILSSPITHQVNMLSTALNTLARPVELALGAEDSISRMRAGRELIYMVTSSFDSLKMAVASLRAEDNILDAGAMISDVERFAIRSTGKGPVAKLVNGLGTLYRIPSRFLLAEDEFFKQINFRAFAMADAWEKGTRQGLTGDALKDFMKEQFDGVVKIVNQQSKDGIYSKEILDLYDRAKQFAAETTFTNNLGKGTLSGDFQSLVSKHPSLRIFFPFVRTPLNILKSTFRRTPGVNRYMKEHMDAIRSTDPSVRARAIGESRVGGLMWLAGLSTAAAVNVPNAPIAITGGGPKDFNLLNQKKATGWQPYSFRFLVKPGEYENVAKKGKANETIKIDQDTTLVRGADGNLKYRYVSYKRLDPWASYLSMSADMAEIAGQIPSGEWKDFVEVLGVGIARNFKDKTYLQGLTELANLFNNEQGLSTWVARRLAALTNPLSAGGRDAKKTFDSVSVLGNEFDIGPRGPNGERVILDKKVRPGDATGPMVIFRRYLNELAATVPGWNNDLPAIQNWITGQYVEYPVGFGPDNWNVLLDGWSTDTQTINDPVLSVLADMEASFEAPKASFLNGEIPLNKKQYAQLIYMTASEKKGNLRLYDALLKEINKPSMQAEIRIARGLNITNTNQEASVAASDDSRKYVLQQLGNIIREYKARAKERFLDLPDEEIQRMKDKYDQQVILQNKIRKEERKRDRMKIISPNNPIEALQTL